MSMLPNIRIAPYDAKGSCSITYPQDAFGNQVIIQAPPEQGQDYYMSLPEIDQLELDEVYGQGKIPDASVILAEESLAEIAGFKPLANLWDAPEAFCGEAWQFLLTDEGMGARYEVLHPKTGLFVRLHVITDDPNFYKRPSHIQDEKAIKRYYWGKTKSLAEQNAKVSIFYEQGDPNGVRISVAWRVTPCGQNVEKKNEIADEQKMLAEMIGNSYSAGSQEIDSASSSGAGWIDSTTSDLASYYRAARNGNGKAAGLRNHKQWELAEDLI